MTYSFPGCTYTALAVGVRREYNDIVVFPPSMLTFSDPTVWWRECKEIVHVEPIYVNGGTACDPPEFDDVQF